MNNGTRRIYTEPTSMEAARNLREEIIDEIEAIELQLGDDRLDLDDDAYAKWRGAALTAHRARKKVLRKLNRWIADASTSRAQ